jgi:tetratricopeptide (TPR) repeat protein
MENAIDDYLKILTMDANNKDALVALSDIYISKRRYAPALNFLQRLSLISPSDSYLIAKKKEILALF